MVALDESTKQLFFSNLEAYFKEEMERAPHLSKPLRQRAWDHFLKLGLPDKKEEAFQYFPLSLFYEESFKKQLVPPIARELIAKEMTFVFVDGEFSKELSDLRAAPKQLIALPLADGYQTYGSFLHSRLEKSLKVEKNPFASLNLALETKGLFLFVPPKTQIEAPIHCIQLFSGEKKGLYSPRIQLFIGSGSQLSWISTIHSLGDGGYWSNGVMDIALEEGSHFDLTTHLNIGDKAWHFNSYRATLKRDSSLVSTQFGMGGRGVRDDYQIFLQGENCEAKLKGISLLHGQRQAHTHVLMGHQAPHTRSSQLFKSVVDDAGKSSFQGKIFVEKEAQKTEAYQSNHNLLLGGHAIAYSKPNLEIFADDVKASHGSTISKLKELELFYLKTRGLSSETAKRLLILAFSQEVINTISDPLIRQKMERQTEEFLK